MGNWGFCTIPARDPVLRFNVCRGLLMLFKIVPEQRIGRFASVFQGDAFFQPGCAAQNCAVEPKTAVKIFLFCQ
jgi:hypothetical protein